MHFSFFQFYEIIQIDLNSEYLKGMSTMEGIQYCKFKNKMRDE